MKDSLKGIIFTMKLLDKNWGSVNSLTSLLQDMASFVPIGIRATQLPSNRKEITAFGLTPLGSKYRIIK
jgi:hypothetical protein